MYKFVFKCSGDKGLRTSYCVSAKTKFEAFCILISMVERPSLEMSSLSSWYVCRSMRGKVIDDVIGPWNGICIWACE